MAIRITIKRNTSTYEFFYKKVSKEIKYIPIGHKISEIRLDADIKKLEDIKRIREFLDNLELSMDNKPNSTTPGYFKV